MASQEVLKELRELGKAQAAQKEQLQFLLDNVRTLSAVVLVGKDGKRSVVQHMTSLEDRTERMESILKRMADHTEKMEQIKATGKWGFIAAAVPGVLALVGVMVKLIFF